MAPNDHSASKKGSPWSIKRYLESDKCLLMKHIVALEKLRPGFMSRLRLVRPIASNLRISFVLDGRTVMTENVLGLVPSF